MAKEQVGAKINRATIERLRNAIYWIGRGLTIQRCVEEAILAKVEELEEKYNEGKPFEKRGGELPHSNKPASSLVDHLSQEEIQEMVDSQAMIDTAGAPEFEVRD
jgi:hypothetical protein